MRVLMSGGGTGGHIYPALAIIREIQKQEPDSTFLYVGTSKGLEADIVPKAGIPFETIEISGFKRKISFENVRTIMRFLQAVKISKQKIQIFKPDVVIGTGGYVCGPVVYAASRMQIPTLIHEQNVIPGLTNKFLSRYVQAIAVSFDGSLSMFKHHRVQVTGNPRATEVAQANAQAGRESLHIPKDKRLALLVGGSRGAKAINEAFIGMTSRLSEWPDVHFVYITGDEHYDDVIHQLQKQQVDQSQLTIKPFVYNMPDILAATHLIINRAGASFLAEITALGLPSILIPSPYVTNQHQDKNARWLQKQGASVVLSEEHLTSETLADHVNHLLKDERLLKQMRGQSARLGKPQAATDIYELLRSLIKR